MADEMRRCVPSDTAGLWRFETNREITIVAAAADPEALARWPVGTRTPVDGDTLATLVQRSGGPARIDSYDNVAGPIAARVREVGVRAAVGVPIIVDGRVWGLTGVGSMHPARCRPTPRPASAASPNWPPLPWSPGIATSRNDSSWLRRHDDRIWPPILSAGASNAICTTAPSNTWSPWRWTRGPLKPPRPPSWLSSNTKCRASRRGWPRYPWSCRKSARHPPGDPGQGRTAHGDQGAGAPLTGAGAA